MIATEAITDGSDNLLHFGGVRMRVQGAGTLQMTLLSLGEVKSSVIQPLTMQEEPGFEPFKLSNFISQRAFLKGTTTNLNDFFSINRIIVYVKEYGSQYIGI